MSNRFKIAIFGFSLLCVPYMSVAGNFELVVSEDEIFENHSADLTAYIDGTGYAKVLKLSCDREGKRELIVLISAAKDLAESLYSTGALPGGQLIFKGDTSGQAVKVNASAIAWNEKFIAMKADSNETMSEVLSQLSTASSKISFGIIYPAGIKAGREGGSVIASGSTSGTKGFSKACGIDF